MEGKPGSMGRREFLKKAGKTALAVGATAVGVGAGVEVVSLQKKANKEKGERLRLSTATIIRKISEQSHTSIMPGQGVVMIIPFEVRKITVLIDGEEQEVLVSEDRFKALNEGDSVTLQYEETAGGPKNIKLVKE